MLELRNVEKIFDGKVILKNINFKINKGELVCLLGPSGCGKSTILNIIGGFVKEDDGEIFLDNEKVNDKYPEQREVATVFQSYGLFPHKSVLDNIRYGLKFKNISKRDSINLALEMLKKVELEGYEKKKISELSGGEKQRVALARSLVLNPKVLLLDEPFSSLDANLKVIMRREVKRLQQEFGITTLIVTHDQEDAFEIADRVIILNDGKVEQIDTMNNIYNKPKNKFVLEFIGKSNVLEIDDDIKYCRYEDVIISKDKPENAIIVDKKLKGSFIEYKIKLDDNRYLSSIVIKDKNYLVNDRVNVEVEFKKIN